MALYRLYFCNPEGHFSGMREIEAHSDRQAIHMADIVCRGQSCELWHDQTILRRWSGEQADLPVETIRPRPQTN